MIEKLNIDPTQSVATNHCIINKINEIIDTIYDMQLAISSLDPDSEWYDGNHIADISKKVDLTELAKKGEKECRFNPVQADREVYDALTRAENVQITYITDGHTKEYYGQNGASIVTDYPIPAGYVITIKETKGGDNE